MSTHTPFDVRRSAEEARSACIAAAVTAYEDAAMAGLCHQGAWETALGAMRSLELAPNLARGPATGALREHTERLAAAFAAPGAPAAGSAAASSAALAAGLLQWVAGLSLKRGPELFRARARAIAQRAAALRAALARSSEEDACAVQAWLSHKPGRAPAPLHERATRSLLLIGVRCARTARLAAEVEARGYPAIGPDAAVACRLAATAAESALYLAQANARLQPAAAWSLRTVQRIRSVQALLHRAVTDAAQSQGVSAKSG